MALTMLELKTQSDVEKAKQDFINKATFPSREDCRLEIKGLDKLLYQESSTEVVSQEELQQSIEVFNAEKSYLFDFSVNHEKVSNVKKKELMLNVPSIVIEDAGELFYPLMVRVSYIIADIVDGEGISREGFHFPPTIDFVQYMDDEDDAEPEILKRDKTEDYGELLLLGMSRKIKPTHNMKYSLDRDSFESSEFNYQLKHSSDKANIFNDLTVTHKFGRYKASITVESEEYQEESEAREQLARWLQSLGRGLEIAKIITI